MNVSAKVEYACLAMLELAAHHASGVPVRVREIAERHRIPNQFLVQILLQLKTAGLVSSTRGAGGGYHLAREPEEIHLDDILPVVDGRFAEGGASANALAESPATRALSEVWRRAERAQRDVFSQVTLAELKQAASSRAGAGMYYI